MDLLVRRNASRRASAVTDFLRTHIESGTWKAGDRLPTERELEQQFGLARNTLRRSLRALEDQGLITRHVGRGTFVAAGAAEGLKQLDPVDAPPHGLQHRIQAASPAEIMEVRLLIEPQAVAFAAVRATADDLAFLAQCLRGCESATDIASFERWDGLLHERIVRAAGNRLLSDFYEAINAVRQTGAWGKLKERTLTAQRRALYQDQHRRIVDALRDRDAAHACQAVRDHLADVRAGLLGA